MSECKPLAHGEAPALVGTSNAPISFARLVEMSATFATYLGGRDALRAGGAAAVMLDSSDELMVAYFGCLMAGMAFAPVVGPGRSWSGEGKLTMDDTTQSVPACLRAGH